jgi:serine protease Do
LIAAIHLDRWLDDSFQLGGVGVLPAQELQGFMSMIHTMLTACRCGGVLMIGFTLLACDGRRAAAAEPSGLDAVMAFQQVMVDAIASSDRSVVSIARVAKAADAAMSRADTQPILIPPAGGFEGRFNQGPPDPTNPEFVPSAFATGVVLDRRGLVLTNHHVLTLQEPSDFFVTTPARKVFRAKIKAADPFSDLAVLEVVGTVGDTDFTPIKLGDASTLRKGQIVIALGNPYAIARDGQASASWGIVSNLQRKAAATPDYDLVQGKFERKDTLHNFGTLIQTDAKLNLGTSGGALVNLKGEMVGLTTSLAAVAGYEQPAGYAIPVDDTFRRVVEQLKRGRELAYGFLGVGTLRTSEVPGGVPGVRVGMVVMGTPADRAGIRQNDVITRVEDEPIFDVDGLMLQIGKLPAAATAKIVVNRGGRILQRDVTLAKRAVHGTKVVTEIEPAWRGLRVDYPTALEDFMDRVQATGERFDGCVIASDVERDSPAWKAGLRRGALITHVGATAVETPEEFHRQIAKERQSVTLRLLGDGRGASTAVSVVPE